MLTKNDKTSLVNFAKSNFFSFANLIVIAIFIFNQGKKEAQLNSHIINFQKHVINFERHIVDNTMHENYKQKVIDFVPRKEIEIIIEDLKSSQANSRKLLTEIRKDIKSIIKSEKY